MNVFMNAVEMAPYRVLIWLHLSMLETTSANTLVEERCPELLRPTHLASPHSIKLIAYLLHDCYVQKDKSGNMYLKVPIWLSAVCTKSSLHACPKHDTSVDTRKSFIFSFSMYHCTRIEIFLHVYSHLKVYLYYYFTINTCL